jgi:hypothetical protein
MDNSENFYVYCHVKKTDGKCFYVGKGTGNRFKTQNSRNRYWKDIVDQHGFEPIILINNISELNAFKFEAIICENIGYNNIVNIRKEEGWGGHSHQPETLKKLSKPVLQYTKCGTLIRQWDSATQAAKSLKKSHSAAITECCRGLKPYIYGFIWRHIDNPIEEPQKIINRKEKPEKVPPYYHPIEQYDKNGNFIKLWNNAREIFHSLNIKTGSISQCLHGKYKSAGGFIWEKSLNKKGAYFA